VLHHHSHLRDGSPISTLRTAPGKDGGIPLPITNVICPPHLRLGTLSLYMSKKEISFSLATVVFVYLSVQKRWFPVWVHNVTVPVVLVIVFALNVAGWWRLTRADRSATMSRWRKRAALIGLIANTLAIALPFTAVLYGIYIEYLIRRGPVKGSDIVDVASALPAGLCFAACGLLSGTLAPSRIRLLIVLGGLVTCLVILSIPVAIL